MPKLQRPSLLSAAKAIGTLALGSMRGKGKVVSKKVALRRKLGYQKGRALPRQPKTELKAFDLAPYNLDFLNGGAFNILPLNTMVNGPELYQRIGRKVYMKSLHIRAYVENIGVAATPDFGRIFIVYDSQANGGLPGLATLLQDSNAAAASSPQSNINLVNRERFKIIKDYQIITPPVAVVANGPNSINDPIMNTWNINWFIKLNGLETIYNATNGGTVADISSGSLLLITCSVNTNSKWTLSGSSRLRYYD